MPPASPTLSLTRVSKTSFTATVTAPAGINVDLYLKSTVSYSSDYAFYATRVGSGTLTVTSRPANSYQFVYAVCRDSGGSLSLPVFGSVDLNVTNSVNGAIKKYWYENPELTAKIKGGLYINEVPENIEGKNVQLPYCMFTNDSSEFTILMSEQYFEASSVNFVIFAAGAAIADESLDLLQKHFDFKEFPFPDERESVLSITPVSRSLNSENFRYKDGNLIFRGSLMYDIVVSRVR